ncbi:AAA family ATPase [Algibacter sp. 2305UL17-15]|uniref:AAA family ATPase n=1 Tax=Algibacter sp. 2305UL17-15 TaxID=3231268 RepID=UPI0034589E40
MQRAKLIVKNFGPLKDINIEVRETVCFIGKQATGKSTLAKLLAIFEDENFRKNRNSKFISELSKYNLRAFLSPETSIYYKRDNYEVSYSKNNLERLSKMKFGIPFSDDSLYIPSERNFLHLIAENTLGLINNEVSIPKHILDIGQEYEKAISTIKELPLKLIDKNYTYKREGKTSYIYHNNDEKVNLLESASGLQSILPILLLVEYAKSKTETHNYNFVIEEPELNIYPETQHELIKYLIKNCQDNQQNHIHRKNLILTTHSPYVLASINNLLLAFEKGKTFNKEVQRIIPKGSWLNPNNFIAYELKNGKARKIMDDKLGQIKNNMIDNASENFADEFDKILSL